MRHGASWGFAGVIKAVAGLRLRLGRVGVSPKFRPQKPRLEISDIS